MKKNHHLILIPTYNEASNCIQIIDAIKKINAKAPAAFDICFIDDNSPDGTSDLIQKNKDRLSPNNIHIINRQYKKGLGPAYMAGFHFSIQSNYNYVYQLDCDFSHNPEDCLQLQQNLINGADFVIGSRYCKGGATKNWAALREIISRSAAIYIFLMTGLPIKDPTAGFSGINVSLLKKLLSKNNWS